jgi:hypothetical protein
LWAKCQNHKETIALVQTDLNTVIGCYCPDKWENTERIEDSCGWDVNKKIISGCPFLFYCLDNQIQIIRHRDDRIQTMSSNKDWLIEICNGLHICANKKSEAYADEGWFVHPQNT